MNAISQAANNPAAPANRWRRLSVGLGMLALAGVLVSVVVWQTRERWLSAMIQAWVVNQPVERADAVMVLGGGAQFRSFEAVRFHREGVAAKVLFPHIKPGLNEPGATVSSETTLIGRVLDFSQLAPTDREEIGRDVTSTREEVAALRGWADRNQARVIIVPTDPFHTRRLKALTRELFAGAATRVLVTAVDPPHFRWQEWWRDEQGFLAFQNELLKGMQNAFK